jgi:hypothetical protein
MGMERALYIRERNDGLYRPIIYLLYKFLDELLLMLPVTSATTATVFLACRLQGSFLLFWLVNFVTLANGTGMTHLQSVNAALAAMVAVRVAVHLGPCRVGCHLALGGVGGSGSCRHYRPPQGSFLLFWRVDCVSKPLTLNPKPAVALAGTTTQVTLWLRMSVCSCLG